MLQNQVAPPRLDFDAVQQGRLGGRGEIRIVGVPVLGPQRRLVGRAVGLERAHHDRHFGRRAAALVAQQLGLRLAERPGEAQRLRRRHALARDHDQEMLGQRAVQQGGDGGLVRSAALEALDAPAQRAFQGNDLGHAASLARPRA